MRYFTIISEGYHAWGGDPTYWLEVNDRGDAERELQVYPNGNVLCYDRAHEQDEYGALSTMVIDGDEDCWAANEITKEEFEKQWRARSPFNRVAEPVATPDGGGNLSVHPCSEPLRQAFLDLLTSTRVWIGTLRLGFVQ